jgi:hypothetical protein
MDDTERAQILDRLERGEIDAEEALRQLDEEPAQAAPGPQPDPLSPAIWRHWWLILLVMGVTLLGGGYGLSLNGGWWWLVSAPLLVLGILLTVLGGSMFGSPWVHIRIEKDTNGSQSTFGLSVPLPLRPTIWAIRVFGKSFKGLDRTGIDELLLAMEGAIGQDAPAIIDVQQDDSGETVRVYIG